MGKVTVLPGHDLNALAHLAGSNRRDLSLIGDEFEVPDVVQSDLDATLADYTANQAERDAAFAEKQAEKELDKKESEFNEAGSLKAIVGFLVEQINELRAAQSLPLVAFDFKTAMKKVK